MAKQSDKLAFNDRVMSICGSVNLRDFSSLDRDKLANLLVTLFESWTALRDYYFIFHDGTDTYHFHYILMFSKQHYVSNVVNRLCECLSLDVEAVNYRKLLHRNAHLRYLLHIDNESRKNEKKEFPLYDLYTNVNYNLVRCFLDSKDDNNKLDMLTLEGICVQCKGDELKVAEFLDELYDKNYRKIRLILDNYFAVQEKFSEGEFYNQVK